MNDDCMKRMGVNGIKEMTQRRIGLKTLGIYGHDKNRTVPMRFRPERKKTAEQKRRELIDRLASGLPFAAQRTTKPRSRQGES